MSKSVNKYVWTIFITEKTALWNIAHVDPLYDEASYGQHMRGGLVDGRILCDEKGHDKR